MAYLGYKNKAFRKYKEQQEKIRLWKEAEAKKRKKLKLWIKEKERKKKRIKEWCNVAMVSILHIAVITLIIVFYAALTLGNAKAQPIGVGNFVMAVSYTDSYKDLQYVANFPNCEMAQNYYDQNCIDAKIMLCQLEEYLQLPESYSQDFTYASTDKHSCGFVGVQQTHTFIEE